MNKAMSGDGETKGRPSESLVADSESFVATSSIFDILYTFVRSLNIFVFI